MANILAILVNEDTITSSPFLIPSVTKAKCSAVVPLFTVTACFVLQNFENFFSNSGIYFPKKPDISLSLKALLIFFFSILFIQGDET